MQSERRLPLRIPAISLFTINCVIKNTLRLSVLIIIVCSGCRPVLPDRYQGRQIAVGSGGGFTGMTTTYYLLDNGKLFSKSNRDATYKGLGGLRATRRKQLFSGILDTCQIRTTDYSQPGNVSRFVTFQHGDETHRVTWAVGDTAVPASYPKFYQSFMGVLPPPDQRN